MLNVVWPYLIILLIAYVVGLILGSLFGSSASQTTVNGYPATVHTMNPIVQLLSILIGVYVSILTTRLTLLAVKGKSYTHDLLKSSLRYYWRFLGLGILVGLAITGLLILLVVPAFIFGPRLVLAPYFLLDQDLGAVEAFKASWHQSKGNVGKIYGIIGAEIIMGLLCFVLIGFYFLLMFAAINAVLYYFIVNHSKTKTKTA
jgi:uncharacterized membrane protein